MESSKNATHGPFKINTKNRIICNLARPRSCPILDSRMIVSPLTAPCCRTLGQRRGVAPRYGTLTLAGGATVRPAPEAGGERDPLWGRANSQLLATPRRKPSLHPHHRWGGILGINGEASCPRGNVSGWTSGALGQKKSTPIPPLAEYIRTQLDGSGYGLAPTHPSGGRSPTL